MKRAILLLALIALLIVGCSSSNVKVSTSTGASGGAGGSVPGDIRQELGTQLIESKSIIAIFNADMTLEKRQTQKNYVMIKNGYSEAHTFNIQFDCMLCATENGNSVTIVGNRAEIIGFSVGSAEPGKFNYNIIITDEDNNFYASKSFTVLAK